MAKIIAFRPKKQNVPPSVLDDHELVTFVSFKPKRTPESDLICCWLERHGSGQQDPSV
jgi:hypothetical protein